MSARSLRITKDEEVIHIRYTTMNKSSKDPYDEFAKDETYPCPKCESVPEFTRLGGPDAAVVGWKLEKEDEDEK